ncbi:MAG: ISNCY family transposase [bacterium]
MAGKDNIIMSQKELKRVKIIHEVMKKHLTQKEAAGKIEISDRQIRRLVQRVKEEGEKGLIHKSRGRESNREFSREWRGKILDKCREKYVGFGPTLCMEKLSERDEIKISDETLRKWFVKEGIEYKGRRKGRKHRQWRERKEYFGEMIQMDGSHHDWLEGRGPKMVLMAFIDDAKGEIFCRFYEYEGTIPAMDLMKRYIKRYGIPRSVYLDRHSTYKSTGKLSIEDELAGKQALLSQYERALKGLEIKVIHANSPQAKGRVERLFNTLQDRLIKEMRLENISSMEEANEFLRKYMPKFNKKFSVEAEKETDLHRNIPKGFNLDDILCVKTERAVRNDFTVNHDKKFYQILDCIPARKVTVNERVDGSVSITSKGKRLRYKEIFPVKKEAVKVKQRVKPEKKIVQQLKMPVDYSWRRTINAMFEKEKKAA